jgi:hypothetical protein
MVGHRRVAQVMRVGLDPADHDAAARVPDAAS